ncbi:MAG: YlxR family protein [Coriobacteriaceae bacterium]|nr:YlxR family protein [Coriobacteriaceae bacterium]
MAHTVQGKPKRQRTCIACGAQGDKVGLMRIVRTADGSASFDPTGRVPGRGAYVCSPECFAQAAKGKRLNRALKMQVTEEDYARIAGELECLHDRVHG